jgi:RNA polymerase sigma factor (sigma-70 family)
MSDSLSPTPAIEELLRQPAWIRGLARSLVEDVARADDLVQASWLAALRGDSTGVRHPRSWFARIVRNQARKDAGRARLRADREPLAAKAEASPSTGELVAEVSLQNELTARLLALEPRLREVLILRFYRGLARSEAAERLGISPNTLDSRQSRALELLRERLDTEYGDRTSWCLALVPLAVRGRALGKAGVHAAGKSLFGSTGLAWFGGILVALKTHSTLALLGIAAIVGLLVMSLVLDEPLGPGGAGGEVALVPDMSLPEEVTPAPKASSASTKGAGARPFVHKTDSCTTLTGSLLDSVGLPLHGVRVAWVRRDAAARARELGFAKETRAKLAADFVAVTDKQGVFELGPIPEGAEGEVVVLGYASLEEISDVDVEPDGWLPSSPEAWSSRRAWNRFTLGSGERVAVDGTRERVWITTALAAFRFDVHDSKRKAIAGARITVPYSIRAVRELPFRLETESAECRLQEVVTDKGGRAKLERVPMYRGAIVQVRAPGFRTVELPLGSVFSGAWPIEMERAGAGQPDLRAERRMLEEVAVIRGLVEDPGGRPVVGAVVHLGSNRWWTDKLGRFGADRVVVADLAEPALCIAAEGFTPLCTDALALLGNTDPGHFTRFVLDDSPLEIHGRLNVAGEDYEGFQVELLDSVVADSLGLEMCSEGRSEPIDVEKGGAFTLGGLASRTYRILIWNRSRKIFFETEPIEAGARSVVVAVPESGQRPSILVRVADPSGAPVAGARVSLRFASPELARLDTGGLFDTTLKTGPDGRVRLQDLPLQDLVLEVEGKGLDGATVELAAESTLNTLDVILEPLFDMRPLIPADRRPSNFARLAAFDAIEALDAAGAPLPMVYFDAFGHRVSTKRLQLDLFGFPDFLISGALIELVPYVEGVEMARVSVVPQSPFAINQVDF